MHRQRFNFRNRQGSSGTSETSHRLPGSRGVPQSRQGGALPLPTMDPVAARYTSANRSAQTLPQGPEAALQRGQRAGSAASARSAGQGRHGAPAGGASLHRHSVATPGSAPYAFDYDPSVAAGGARTAATRTARDMALDASRMPVSKPAQAAAAPSLVAAAASTLGTATAHRQQFPHWSAPEMAAARGSRFQPAPAPAPAGPSASQHRSVARSEHHAFDERSMALARARVGDAPNAHASSVSIFGGGGTEFWPSRDK